jgi:hypothetical protein
VGRARQPAEQGGWQQPAEQGGWQQPAEQGGRRQRLDTGAWRQRLDTSAWRQRLEAGAWRQRLEGSAWRQRPEVAGWRQPPETTAEPVPLRRPYIPPNGFPPEDDVTPPLPARTRRRFDAQERVQMAVALPEAASASPAMRRWRPMRAIIGDEVRTPSVWCEFGSCIARYSSEEALSERDLRGRALAAGWCYDAYGRLACPNCRQHAPMY